MKLSKSERRKLDRALQLVEEMDLVLQNRAAEANAKFEEIDRDRQRVTQASAVRRVNARCDMNDAAYAAAKATDARRALKTLLEL